jgi:hypothetical protein
MEYSFELDRARRSLQDLMVVEVQRSNGRSVSQINQSSNQNIFAFLTHLSIKGSIDAILLRISSLKLDNCC